MEFEKKLDIGSITAIHLPNPDCPCMGYQVNVRDTIERILNTKELKDLFVWQDPVRHAGMIRFLKSKDPGLYQNLDEERQTILIRATGMY